MPITLVEIAKLAGVSVSTASRAINGHPNVRPDVRERVLQLVNEHSFEPNPAARLLASRRRGGVISIPDDGTRR